MHSFYKLGTSVKLGLLFATLCLASACSSVTELSEGATPTDCSDISFQSTSLIIQVKAQKGISAQSQEERLEDVLFSLNPVSFKTVTRPDMEHGFSTSGVSKYNTFKRLLEEQGIASVMQVEFESPEDTAYAEEVLRVHHDVLAVEQNQVLDVLEDHSDPYKRKQWYVDQLTLGLAPVYPGYTVKVAVLDTGVDLDHADLQESLLSGGRNVFHSSDVADDDNGHGSHVAGIISAVSNNDIGITGLSSASILPVKVSCSDGKGSYGTLISGINYAMENEVHIINVSLGGSVHSPTLKKVMDAATDSGVIIVAAAGNNSSSTKFYPAAYSSVIGVAATDELGKRVSSSNYGDWVDIAAPGHSIYSTVVDGYGYKTGTSMASPVVAGVIAQLLAHDPSLDLNGLRALFSATSTPIESEALGVGELNGEAIKAFLK